MSLRIVLLGTLAATLAACAAPQPAVNCNARPEGTPYSAVETEAPLPKTARTAVQSYRWIAQSQKLGPCGVLAIKKELIVTREANARSVIKEIREFYADDGTLIVRHVEDVSKQVTRSGEYRGSLALPIPQAAPPGRYRIVSRLMLEPPSDKPPTTLAQTTTLFQVVAADNGRSERASSPRTNASSGAQAASSPRVLKNAVP